MENVCGIHPMEMTGVLASKNVNHYLIIDCRSFMSYNQGRLVESVNIHCPPILKRRSGGFISLENIVPSEHKRSLLLAGVLTNVFVYDDNTVNLTQVPKDSNLLSVIKSLLQQIGNVTVRYIIGGFEAMREECPALCVEQVMTHSNRDRASRERTQKSNSSTFKEPAEILPYLYLGDESHSSQQSVLDRLGITALVNVSSSCNNHFEDRYRYMNIHVDDSLNADLSSWFPAVINFIDEVAASNGKVLVHCWAGISRSATVCIAYIMQKQRTSLEAAFDFVFSRRSVIDPNLNFIQQLQRFESQCLQLRHCPPHSHISYIPPPSPRPCPSNTVFSFSPVSPTHHQPTTSSAHVLSRSSMVPYSNSSQPCRNGGRTESTTSLAEKQELSPSSLSQTAASPNPMRIAPSRPSSLPILQLNAASSSSLPHHHLHHHQYSLSPMGLTLNQGTESLRPSHHLSQSQNKLSPMFEFTHEPEDEVAVAIPVSQGVGFGIFSKESLACPPVLSPHHPTASTSHDVSSSLNLFQSAGEKTSSFPSPISPHGVPRSPLSPVPSFG